MFKTPSYDGFLSGIFEDKAIFHVIQLSYDWGGLYVPITMIDKYIREKCQ